MLVMIMSWQYQNIFSTPIDQMGWNTQELMSQSIDGGPEFIFRQAQALEPMHKVVGQEQRLEKSHIGRPAMGWNMVECHLAAEFAYRLLDIGAADVVGPGSPWCQPEVADQHGVAIVAVFEQRQLPGLLWVQWQGPSNGNEAMGLMPFLGTVFELREAPAQFQVFKAGFLSHLLVSFISATNNGIAASPLVQIVDQGAGKEAGVSQKSDAAPGHPGGDFLQTSFDEMPGARVGAGIAGAE